MIIEAEWLLNYTAEWPKLDQQLEAIEHSLATKDQGFALRQTPDGSWGACYRAWFEKIDGTADFLGDVRMPGGGRPPRLQYPFEILQKINSSQVLIPYLYRLQISQIAKIREGNNAAARCLGVKKADSLYRAGPACLNGLSAPI
jgi:hypothetical protein